MEHKVNELSSAPHWNQRTSQVQQTKYSMVSLLITYHHFRMTGWLYIYIWLHVYFMINKLQHTHWLAFFYMWLFHGQQVATYPLIAAMFISGIYIYTYMSCLTFYIYHTNGMGIMCASLLLEIISPIVGSICSIIVVAWLFQGNQWHPKTGHEIAAVAAK